jgi:hypothetical protein
MALGKYILFSLSVLVLNTCNTKQETSTGTPQDENLTNDANHSENLKFKGVLAEELFLTPPCDSANYSAVTFKFSVVQILDGNYANKEVLMIQPCPELKGEDFFSENTEYVIEAGMENKSNLNFQIFNYYKNSPLPKYWVISVVKINNE